MATIDNGRKCKDFVAILASGQHFTEEEKEHLMRCKSCFDDLWQRFVKPSRNGIEAEDNPETVARLRKLADEARRRFSQRYAPMPSPAIPLEDLTAARQATPPQ